MERPDKSPALLNIHFQVGNLIFADALPSSFVFIDQNFSPYDLRLCACRSIINALNLALQTRSIGTDSPELNILLLDPYPDLMTNAIIRTGSSLFVLYSSQKLPSENVITMFRVVISALEVLAQISHTASEAIPLLKQRFEASGIDQDPATANDILHNANVLLATTLDEGFFDAEVMRELEQQVTDPSLVDRNVEQDGNIPNPLHFAEELDPCDVEFLSRDWTLDVKACILISRMCANWSQDCFAAF